MMNIHVVASAFAGLSLISVGCATHSGRSKPRPSSDSAWEASAVYGPRSSQPA